jgi:uncharacterized membrane protein YhaH (DUF805 family)
MAGQDGNATYSDPIMLTDALRLFFSFRGRASRGGFWLVSLTWVVLGLFFDYAWRTTGAANVRVGQNHLVDAAFWVPLLVLLVSTFAVAARRLHDRNKGAWWVLVFYVAPPLVQSIASLNDLDSAVMVWMMVLSGVLSLWGLIELGCLAGTRGPNPYGPDPLAPAMEHA